jgi:chromate transporter
MINLIIAFLKIGFLGFGGGYAMLSLIYAQSEQLGLSTAQFADLNALDGMIPGPIAINSATYIGQLTGGFWFALAATLTVCIPSLIFVPLYMHYEKRIKSNWLLSAILKGIMPAAAGLVIAVACNLLLSTVFGVDSVFAWRKMTISWPNLLVLGLVLGLDLKYHLNPVWLILIAGVIGGIFYYL